LLVATIVTCFFGAEKPNTFWSKKSYTSYVQIKEPATQEKDKPIAQNKGERKILYVLKTSILLEYILH
jgi:hypothetical protein